MKIKKQLVGGILAGCAMLVVILDTKTALLGVQEGIQLCLQTVVPALFPFLVLTGIIKDNLLGHCVPFLQPVGRLCKIPKGAESLLVLGLLTGYPVGAQLVSQAYHNGNLSLKTARRMLGFCSNAGPAFIFGMLSPLFVNPAAPWLLWGIHIISALITGCLLPGEHCAGTIAPVSKTTTLPQAVERAVKTMALICGWVITFRIILMFITRWFLWQFPPELQALLSGLLELSNGCVLMKNLPTEGIRFVLSSAVLAFGGLCVWMQTLSVTGAMGTGLYFPGKVLQTLFSILFSCLLQPIVFPKDEIFLLPASAFMLLLLLIAISIHFIRGKKVVAFRDRMLYNTNISQ